MTLKSVIFITFLWNREQNNIILTCILLKRYIAAKNFAYKRLLVNIRVIFYSDFMGTELQQDILGKKIFFLFPSGFVKNEVIPELVQLEYEVYISTDEKKLKLVLQKYPSSIVFINIDDGLSEQNWEIWILSVMRANELGTSIGILSSTNDEKIKKKYLNVLKVQAGFIPVKSDFKKILQQFTDIFKKLEAKGRRKYIRVSTVTEPLTTINIPYNGGYLSGQINDISVVGLSCVFEEDLDLAKGVQIKDIQIKLQGVLLKMDGIVFGSRDGDYGKVYVIIFTARINPEVKTKIRKYMQSNLQAKMDAELH